MNSPQTMNAIATGRRISTKYSGTLKFVPFAYFGVLAFILVLVSINGGFAKAPMFLVILGVMGLAGYSYWKQNVRGLADEVDDCGDYLLVRRGGDKETVLLSNIANVSFTVSRDGAQARIKLTLASPGKFGAEISFAPLAHLYLTYPRRSEIADDLLARAEKARSGQPA